MGERAIVYREKYKITKEIANGTAVNVVAMIFGNMGNDSATGVVFKRNSPVGTKKIFGNYLINAECENLVTGIRTTKRINEMTRRIQLTYKKYVKKTKKMERY